MKFAINDYINLKFNRETRTFRARLIRREFETAMSGPSCGPGITKFAINDYINL